MARLRMSTNYRAPCDWHPAQRHASVSKLSDIWGGGWEAYLTQINEGWDEHWNRKFPTWSEALEYALAEVGQRLNEEVRE